MATEKRLIDADDALEQLKQAEKEMKVVTPLGCKAVDIKAVLKYLESRPTVDAVEVVHGEWTIIEDDYCGLIGLECSHCETTWWFDEESPIREYHYCPGCGADMRERKDNVL